MDTDTLFVFIFSPKLEASLFDIESYFTVSNRSEVTWLTPIDAVLI